MLPLQVYHHGPINVRPLFPLSRCYIISLVYDGHLCLIVCNISPTVDGPQRAKLPNPIYREVAILPVVNKDLPISPWFSPANFYRDASSAHSLHLVNQWLIFTLFALSRYYCGSHSINPAVVKNRTHDLRTSDLRGYRNYFPRATAIREFGWFSR